ncbi:hypothetical protein [Roseateles sp. BYS96W]|uniref:Lipoprotein n=1 Tax=Pelomonas nitida TaxID=3299027 RepID=A0ABW7G7F6_9BURK
MRPATHRAAVAAIAALLLTACTGYPSEDAAPANPFDLSNAERLQALQAIGAKANRPERSRFALDGDCRLRVTRSGGDAPADRFEHVLRPGQHVGISFDKVTRVFEVHLLSEAGTGGERLGLLLRSAQWMQASQADLLVQLMIRDCRAMVEPADKPLAAA